MLKKLRIQFICVMMTIITVLLGVIIGMVLHYTAGTMEEQNIRLLQSLTSGPVHIGKKEPEGDFPIMSVWVSEQGDVVSIRGSDFQLTQEQIGEIVCQVLDSQQDHGLLKEYGLRFQWDRSPREDSILFANIKPEQQSFCRLALICFGLGLLSLLVFFILSLVLARWIVKPVEKAWNDQRQFIADASHELKTPLAVIMTNAELLQDPEQNEASRSQFSGSILTMSRQMRSLVEGLLELARVDNGAVKLSFTELDLSEITENAVLSFEVLFFEQGLTLNTSIAPGISLKGSAQHLRQVVDILLDNALKYSIPSGEVTLTLKSQGNHALLSVASPGQEISAGDLKKIFQRFYRIDEARSRTGSYGLGLSIAKSITEDHGGKIWAESRDGINTFFVQLPIS